MSGDREANAVRRGQIALLSGVGALVLAGLVVWLAAAPPPGIQQSDARFEVDLAGGASPERGWVRAAEVRFRALEDEMKTLRSSNDTLAERNETLAASVEQQKTDARHVIDRQANVIKQLTQQLQTNQPRRAAPASSPPGASPRAPGDPFASLTAGQKLVSSSAADGRHPVQAAVVELPLNPLLPASLQGEDQEQSRLLEDWLPAGAYAPAVVIAGVNASAAIESQSEPRPVLFRITGPARGPAAGAEVGDEALEVDVSGCTVIGAAYGDLSSETVYVRLRTMTCASRKHANAIVETQIAGFAAGAGKAGVRGRVVSREGNLIEKAFWAGLLGEVGTSAAAALAPDAVIASTGEAARAQQRSFGVRTREIGLAGLGQGIGNAADRLADHLIRRAEQYQPVIQLHGGTRVTLVFMQGTRLGGKRAAASHASPEEASASREAVKRAAIRTLQGQKP